MEAKNRVISLVQMQQAVVSNLTIPMGQAIAQAQDEVSFKAGVREVVEWVQSHSGIAFGTGYEWRDQLEEWGIIENLPDQEPQNGDIMGTLSCGCEFTPEARVLPGWVKKHYEHTFDVLLAWEVMEVILWKGTSPPIRHQTRLLAARIEMLAAIEELFPEAPFD